MLLWFQAHYELQHRSITPYYNSVINVTMDICGFFNGTDQNMAIKWLVGQYKASLPKGFLQPCPFKEIKAYNLTTDMNSLMSNFFRGNYRAALRFYDDIDDNIFSTFYSMEYN